MIGLDVLGAALTLAAHADADGTISMTTAAAAVLWRISDRSAARMLAELQQSQILRKVSAGNKAGAYVFVPDTDSATSEQNPSKAREYMLCQNWHNVKRNVNSVMTGLADGAKSGITEPLIDEERGRGRARAVAAFCSKTKGNNSTPESGGALAAAAVEAAPSKPEAAPSTELQAARAYLRGLGVTAAAIDRAERNHGPQALADNAAALKARKTPPTAALAAAAIRDNYAGDAAQAKRETAQRRRDALQAKTTAKTTTAQTEAAALAAELERDRARAARVAALPADVLAQYIDRIKSGEAGAFMARSVRAKRDKAPAEIATGPGVSVWIADQLEMLDV